MTRLENSAKYFFYLHGLELSEDELGDEGADKGGGNLRLGMAPGSKEFLIDGVDTSID